MALCEHALFLFREPDIVIRELKRVLKKKAHLIISAHNRYIQSLVSLPEKPNSEHVNTAIDILQNRRYNAIDKEGKVKIYTWTPSEFREMLERNGFHVEKIIGKGYTMPLRISNELFTKIDLSENLFNEILQFELTLCEKPDALALAGHLQAIAEKH